MLKTLYQRLNASAAPGWSKKPENLGLILTAPIAGTLILRKDWNLKKLQLKD